MMEVPEKFILLMTPCKSIVLIDESLIIFIYFLALFAYQTSCLSNKIKLSVEQERIVFSNIYDNICGYRSFTQ